MSIAISCIIIGLFLFLLSSAYLFDTWKNSTNKKKFILSELIELLFLSGSIKAGVSYFALIGLISTIFGIMLLYQELTL